MGEVDRTGIFVLQLFKAAARAAVAQTLPFGVGHFLQRLGFPEKSLLGRGCFGRRGHKSLKLWNDLRIGPSMGCAARGASGRQTNVFCRHGVHPDDQMSERDHWFMAPARLEQTLESPRGATPALGSPQQQRKTFRR